MQGRKAAGSHLTALDVRGLRPPLMVVHEADISQEAVMSVLTACIYAW